MRNLVTTIICVALLVGGCAAQDGSEPDADAQAIREAREVLGNAISQLGAAVVATEETVTSLRLGDPPQPDERRAAIEDARTGTLQALDDALSTTALNLPDEPAAVRDAQEGWEAARTTGKQLREAAEADLDHTAHLADIDAELAEIIASWDTPGSYSQQVERFTSMRNRARSIARDLREEEPRPDCSSATDRRREAAEWVASATDELQTLIESRRGEEFDARRQELEAEPYGFEGVDGSPSGLLGRSDERDDECWRTEGATPTAAQAFDDAIERIERALNPDPS